MAVRRSAACVCTPGKLPTVQSGPARCCIASAKGLHQPQSAVQSPQELVRAGLVNKHWSAVASSKDAWAWRLHSTLPGRYVEALAQCPWPKLWWILKPANLLMLLDCYEQQSPTPGFSLCQAPLKASARQVQQGAPLHHLPDTLAQISLIHMPCCMLSACGVQQLLMAVIDMQHCIMLWAKLCQSELQELQPARGPQALSTQCIVHRRRHWSPGPSRPRPSQPAPNAATN